MKLEPEQGAMCEAGGQDSKLVRKQNSHMQRARPRIGDMFALLGCNRLNHGCGTRLIRRLAQQRPPPTDASSC